MKLLILCFTFSLFIVHAQKDKNVAVVKFVRGNAKVKAPGSDSVKIKKGEWIKEGSIIKTAARSVVKLSFIDKSSMNIGPNSEMKVEKFAKDEAGVIEVLSGKIRSQVSKNYMDMKKGKSKLFVKSKSAVMGIRGTDFIFSTNRNNGQSSAVLFEGSVVFNKNDGQRRGPAALESLVDRGVRIKPGQFSVASRDMKRPTFPAKLDRRQFNALAKNVNLDSQQNQRKGKVRNVVPKGLPGDLVTNDIKDLKNEIKKNFKMDVEFKKKEINMEVANGGQVDGFIKPPDGSPLHIESASVLPMSSNSTFDKNTGEWQSQEFNVDSTGNVVPPEGFSITDEGKLLKDDGAGQVKEVVYEIKPPMDQKPIEELPTQKLNIRGPQPAGNVDNNNNPPANGEGSAQNVNGQDWFVPNSQLNRPRFIGPNGNTLPSTNVNIRVNKQ